MPDDAERPVALDTSVAVPLLVAGHVGREPVRRWAAGRTLRMSGHAAAETYAVLTRLPGDARLAPQDAARLLEARFGEPLTLGVRAQRRLAGRLASAGVGGGATYDALVALAALEHDLPLASRDARALATYRAIGVELVTVPD